MGRVHDSNNSESCAQLIVKCGQRKGLQMCSSCGNKEAVIGSRYCESCAGDISDQISRMTLEEKINVLTNGMGLPRQAAIDILQEMTTE